MLIELNIHQKQQLLREKYKISILVKHYSSGSFSFEVKHFDGIQWIKKSAFMEKSYMKYDEALEGGIEWVTNSELFTQILKTCDFIKK